MSDRLARLIAIAGLAAIAVSATRLEQDTKKPPSNRRNFVTCPVVRDTSTVPCWLAEYEGELYYLGSQGSSASAFYPPQLGHEALVEGAIVDGPRICGGRPLQPVRVSVMRELTPACNTVLPAEPGLTSPPSPIAPVPTFPDSTREFVIPYDFDSDYLTLHTTRIVIEAARIARSVDAARVDVRGERGATLLSNGRTLVEGPRIGEVRASRMGENLVGLGVPADRVHVTWERETNAPDGVTDADRRRVTITLRAVPSFGRSVGAADGTRAEVHRERRRALDRSRTVEGVGEDSTATPPRDGRMLLLAELFKIARGESQHIETVMHDVPYGARSAWAGK